MSVETPKCWMKYCSLSQFSPYLVKTSFDGCSATIGASVEPEFQWLSCNRLRFQGPYIPLTTHLSGYASVTLAVANCLSFQVYERSSRGSSGYRGSQRLLWMKSRRVVDLVWRIGWPLTTIKNFSSPCLLLSILTSLKRFRLNKIFPGKGGITTLSVSSSRIFRNVTKSLYRLLTLDCLFLKAGIFVRHTIS